MRLIYLTAISFTLGCICCPASFAQFDVYSSGYPPEVWSKTYIDPDRFTGQCCTDKDWKAWSENLDNFLKQSIEARVLALSTPLGRIPRAARVRFSVTNTAKVQDVMIVTTSLNEKFDQLIVETVKCMKEKFVLLFPAGSKRTSVIKSAWVSPTGAAEEACKGESWTQFMSGNCDFYIFKKKDEKNIKKMNQEIAEFNKTHKSVQSFKDFLVIDDITNAQPTPDPDDGYGYPWLQWSNQLNRDIFEVVVEAAIHNRIERKDVPQNCKVCFTVTKNAEITDITLIQSSQNKALDQLVLDVIKTRSGRQSLLFPKFSKRLSVRKTVEVNYTPGLTYEEWDSTINRRIRP